MAPASRASLWRWATASTARAAVSMCRWRSASELRLEVVVLAHDGVLADAQAGHLRPEEAAGPHPFDILKPTNLLRGLHSGAHRSTHVDQVPRQQSYELGNMCDHLGHCEDVLPCVAGLHELAVVPTPHVHVRRLLWCDLVRRDQPGPAYARGVKTLAEGPQRAILAPQLPGALTDVIACHVAPHKTPGLSLRHAASAPTDDDDLLHLPIHALVLRIRDSLP
mmetsp:Transcript_21384/g.64201  ORF Transcript_21384/g.64201 Transcript_21384/m.64201 type:complete len:222 (+) Transcript_21384:42-707(+)